jgi:hypothetical protein
VSTPLAWDEVAGCRPEAFTVLTIPERLAAIGDPGEGIDGDYQSIEPLLAWVERDERAGEGDAPLPPMFPKGIAEPPRVQPSRQRMEG